MNVESTGRIIDPAKEQKKLQNLYEENKNRRKIARAKNNFKLLLQKTCKCTQCKRGMSKDFGDKQLFYGRENAPICMACIMGYKRISLKEKKELFKQKVSPETRKKMTKFIRKVKKNNK
jgi:hypothetical protein